MSKQKPPESFFRFRFLADERTRKQLNIIFLIIYHQKQSYTSTYTETTPTCFPIFVIEDREESKLTTPTCLPIFVIEDREESKLTTPTCLLIFVIEDREELKQFLYMQGSHMKETYILYVTSRQSDSEFVM